MYIKKKQTTQNLKIIATSAWSRFPNDKIKIFTLLGWCFPTHNTMSQPYRLHCWPLHLHWEQFILIFLHLSFYDAANGDEIQKMTMLHEKDTTLWKKCNTLPSTKSEACFQMPAWLSIQTFSSRLSPQFFQFQRGLSSFSLWMPPTAFEIVRPTFSGQDKQMAEACQVLTASERWGHFLPQCYHAAD